MDKTLTVFYDGACPLCRREIAWYRQQDGAASIDWRDVSVDTEPDVAPGLTKDAALRRFHVLSSDGRLLSGARAFVELWSTLPGLQRVSRALRHTWIMPVLELGYRAFLAIRPVVQRLACRSEQVLPPTYPEWLIRDLRSDHAGETGAVAIYRGILFMTRDPGLREFATRHLHTERRHLETMEQLVPSGRRSRLLAVWRAAGFLTGALPALFGARAAYATIDAVESFVDRHYATQIDALGACPRLQDLRDALHSCWKDELDHRDEARSRSADRGVLLRAWLSAVGWGSHLGVAVARRL